MDPARLKKEANFARFDPASETGHYESYFLRANHPEGSPAFWIRYTVFAPAGEPSRAIGELWAAYFDRASGTHTAAKLEVPVEQCTFARGEFRVGIKENVLESGIARGRIPGSGTEIEWNLNYSGDSEPLFDLPHKYYSGGFPKAKVLVSLPLARFSGHFRVNDRTAKITDWIGSQNHNWGVKHTDHYAWGQVAGFENRPDTFLEVATARLKIGPLWTPFLTMIVLRHDGREYPMNRLSSALGRGSFDYFKWNFRGSVSGLELSGSIRAAKEDFVCLPYYNPPGGVKYCLNSKIADCELRILRPDGKRENLRAESRAAFEILTDDRSGHGLRPAV